MIARWLFLILLAFAVPASAAPTPAAGNLVEITRTGDRWIAEFTFDRKAPAWAFMRSNVARESRESWRLKSWTVLTPGVELKRIGAYDALVARKGTVPTRVQIRFTPFARGLMADYDPALKFTDGSTALYTGHWDAFPMESEAKIKALPADLNGVPIEGFASARLTVRYPGGRVHYDGRHARELSLVNSEAYVMFGDAKSVESAAITTVVDPQLPGWLASEILSFTPRLLDIYASKLGPRTGTKPMVMVSWAGPTPKLRSLGGSVLPGLVIMRMEGVGLVSPSDAATQSARWFIAHESVHFWLGQTVHYTGPGEGWITEGGADLLAIRAVASVDPAFNSHTPLQDRLDECQVLAAKGPIASAFERNDHQVYYSCGTMFGLAAEAAARKSGGDFFSFIRGAIDSNRTDMVLDRADWLAAMTKASGDPRAAAIISEMLDKATPDAGAKLAALFDATGVVYSRSSDGKLILK